MLFMDLLLVAICIFAMFSTVYILFADILKKD